MKKYLFYFILVVLAGFVLVFLSDADEIGWFRARIGNKSTDYAQYMKANPEGWHYFEARKRFDEQSWKEAQQGGTLAHVQNYLKQNPEGSYVDSANERIISLLWSQVNLKNTITDYEEFIKQYPDSKYISDAKQYLEELVWRKVAEERNIEKVKTFIETYPDGKNIEQANNLLEELKWKEILARNNDEAYLEYIKLYPAGTYYSIANNNLSKSIDAIPVYIDSYHLYDLTTFDRDFGYIFENQIKDIISGIKNVKIVPNISDAVIHLQIGYALSFREGQTDDDNISKFIENRWRDRAVIKQERVKATYDIGLHLYLWDIANDCLLAFSSSVTPPEPGNAAPARNIGRDRFLDDQVKLHIDKTFIKSMRNLFRGKDDVMCISWGNPESFYRQDIGKPKRRVYVNLENGPISVYHWRDPSIEKYIYYHLQQSDIDCVRTFDENNYKLQVVWSKYSRPMQIGTPLRGYGLKADFTIYEKDKEKQEKIVFNRAVGSDFNMEEYGILPIEVIDKWRQHFDKLGVIDELMKKLKVPSMNDRL